MRREILAIFRTEFIACIIGLFPLKVRPNCLRRAQFICASRYCGYCTRVLTRPRRMHFRVRGERAGGPAVNCTPDKTRKQLFNLIRSTCAALDIYFHSSERRRRMQHALLEHASFVDISTTKLVSSRLALARVRCHEIQFSTRRRF